MNGDEMSVDLWALFRPNMEPKKACGDLRYLIRWLDKQKLPGEPSDWVVVLLKTAETEGRATMRSFAGRRSRPNAGPPQEA